MADDVNTLLKDKFICLFLIIFLVCVDVFFRTWGTAATLAGVGFVENLILLVGGSFLALLKQTATTPIDARPQSGGRTTVNTEGDKA